MTLLPLDKAAAQHNVPVGTLKGWVEEGMLPRILRRNPETGRQQLVIDPVCVQEHIEKTGYQRRFHARCQCGGPVERAITVKLLPIDTRVDNIRDWKTQTVQVHLCCSCWQKELAQRRDAVGVGRWRPKARTRSY